MKGFNLELIGMSKGNNTVVSSNLAAIVCRQLKAFKTSGDPYVIPCAPANPKLREEPEVDPGIRETQGDIDRNLLAVTINIDGQEQELRVRTEVCLAPRHLRIDNIHLFRIWWLSLLPKL